MYIFINNIRFLLATYFMTGVRSIGLIVQIALCEQIPMYNLHNQFCMAELLQSIIITLVVELLQNIDWIFTGGSEKQ